MRIRIIPYVTGVFFLLLVPYVLTMAINGMDTALLTRTPDVEACLPAMVSMQISDEYDRETIKSQTVIARTNLYRRLMEKESLRDILGEIRENLGTGFAFWQMPKSVYEKAAEQTEGQVLAYEGELVLVPYHEISSGRTRDGTEVFHDEAYSYLQAVDSSSDKKSPDYLNSTYIAQQQMPKSLEVAQRDSSGYILSLLADGNPLEGEAFRQGMGLSSSDFTIQKFNGKIRFLCKGIGHGLGFSQYGGNAAAEEGSTYEEILQMYFPSMELTQISGIFTKK